MFYLTRKRYFLTCQKWPQMYTPTTHMFITHSCFHPLNSLSPIHTWPLLIVTIVVLPLTTSLARKSAHRTFLLRVTSFPRHSPVLAVNEVTDQYHNIVEHVACCTLSDQLSHLISPINHETNLYFVIFYQKNRMSKSPCKKECDMRKVTTNFRLSNPQTQHLCCTNFVALGGEKVSNTNMLSWRCSESMFLTIALRESVANGGTLWGQITFLIYSKHFSGIDSV